MEISKPESIITLAKDQNLIGFWEWDISAKMKYMSPVFKEMLGYEDHELSNDPDTWINLIVKEDRPSVISAYQKHVASRGGRPYEVRARYHHKNGGIVYILSKGKVVEWDYMGNPVKMIGYYIDVSSVVNEYSGLQERHNQYKTVVDFLKAGIWTHDVRTGKNNWSENIYETTAYKQNELTPSYFNLLHVLSHPEDSGKLVQAINEQIRNREPYDLYVRLLNKEKNYDWFETSGNVEFDEEGKPAKVTGFFIKQKPAPGEEGAGKIPAAKQTQEPATVATEPAAELPSLNGIRPHATTEPQAENIPAATTAEEGRLKGDWEYNLTEAKFSFSKEVYELLELPPDASMRFQAVNNMFTKESQILFQKSFNTAVYSREPYEVTLLFKTPSGKLKLVKEKGRPVVDETGKVGFLRGTLETVKENERTSPEAMAFLKILSDQNQQLWNFAHIASHNLRSHSSNLQMTLELMNNCETEEEKKMFIAPIKKISAAFSQSIINLNKLLFTETDLSKAKVNLDFADVLTNVRSALTSQISETNTTIDADFSKCPTIDYVPAYLESIMLNLISNAIKYRHPQRPAHIILYTFIREDKKVLVIKDNGIGMDLKKYRNTLFTMQQPINRHADSRGLGLLITKNQIESLGGTIEVESEPGEGTTFTITF